MKIYHLSQDIVKGYDTYSDCVVAAENEYEARRTHPARGIFYDKDKWVIICIDGEKMEIEDDEYLTWVKSTDIDKIEVTEIGEAKEGIQKRVICASYHAG